MFAYIREIDRDKASHLLDVLHSLMVRRNNHLLPQNQAYATEEVANGLVQKDRISVEETMFPYMTLDYLHGIIHVVECGGLTGKTV